MCSKLHHSAECPQRTIEVTTGRARAEWVEGEGEHGEATSAHIVSQEGDGDNVDERQLFSQGPGTMRSPSLPRRAAFTLQSEVESPAVHVTPIQGAEQDESCAINARQHSHDGERREL